MPKETLKQRITFRTTTARKKWLERSAKKEKRSMGGFLSILIDNEKQRRGAGK